MLVGTVKPVAITVENPHANRRLVRNTTAAGDVYLLMAKSMTGDDNLLMTDTGFKLVGLDELEIKHYKGRIWALSKSATCDVRVFEE